MAARQPLPHGLLLLTVAANVALVPDNGCHSETVVKKNTIEASVGSPVLIPCYFDLKVYHNGVPNNTAVIWKRQGESLVEVGIPNSKPKFWGDWFRNIDVLSNNGNFSIVLKKFGLNYVGNFSCDLYEGVHCLMETWQISLTIGTSSGTIRHHRLAGTVSGVFGFVTLLLIAAAVVVVHRNRAKRVQQQPPHPEYEDITYSGRKAHHVEQPPPHSEYQYIAYPVQQGLAELPPLSPEYDYIIHPAPKELLSEVMENPIYL
ncbi:uncharacterized protein [Pleurodeles waltl]|uniref:uncharacterized protein isoform X1 n=1 Tax=Pleurodeles waltl TaxID=8319 RepID=UPI003709A94E